VIRAYRSSVHAGHHLSRPVRQRLGAWGLARKLSPEVQHLLGAFRFHRPVATDEALRLASAGQRGDLHVLTRPRQVIAYGQIGSPYCSCARRAEKCGRQPGGRLNVVCRPAAPSRVSALGRFQSGFGPQSAQHLDGEEGEDMMTILIIVLVLFVLGGGGWGYSRWRG
jgi:hypothetical protein